MDLNDEKIRNVLLDVNRIPRKYFLHILKNIDELDEIADEIAPILDEYYYYAEETTDEEELWIIAKYSSDTLAKTNALNNPNFKNEDLLYDIVKSQQKSNYRYVRQLASEKITNPHYLIDIAKNDPHKDNRHYSEQKICEITGDRNLIDNIHENDPKARLSKVESIADEETLIGIAKNDSHINVRKAAIDRIEDKQALISIAENDEWCVSDIAMDKIHDDATLIDIFNSSTEFKIKKNAILHITDPIFLAKTAKDKEEKEMLRAAAASRITSQKTLRDIAINCPRKVGIAAVDNPHLKKNTFLYEISIKTSISIYLLNKCDSVKIHAINKMTDKKLLKKLLKKNREKEVKEYIKKRLEELE